MCAKKQDKDRAPNPFVSTPMRAAPLREHKFRHIFSSVASRFPNLKKELEIAEMDTTPIEFVRKSLISSAVLTAFLEAVILWLFLSQAVSLLTTAAVFLITLPLIFILSFNAALYSPHIKIMRRGAGNRQGNSLCGQAPSHRAALRSHSL
ncbi:MAG: hypothetical protein V1822_02090 [Candidatus Micrarchaeota archaeon]